MTIGDVLKELKAEFPDVTISKIRFLEAEGLVEPERTPSGYRKFSPADLARLRHVLELQRDHFMPLKVIRQRLEDFDPDRRSERPARDAAPGARAAAAASADDDELGAFETGLSLTLEELAASSGVDTGQLEELEEYGLIEPDPSADGRSYDEDDLLVARIARDFGKYGLQPRHLKMYRHFVDREFALFEQVVGPRTRGGAQDGRRQQSMAELAKLSRRLKQILLRNALRAHARD